MWSRRFLWTGLLTGIAVAALTLAELWLGLFIVSRSNDPTWTFANSVKFALPGLIVYSTCWYIVIFRNRDYSLYRTLTLVVATFGAVSVVVAAFMMFAGFYGAITMLLAAARPWEAALFVAWTPFAFALATAIGAAFLIVPYMIVATPMALVHRWLLLRVFASAGPATPNIRPSVPTVPSR
jgi:hypothetical protein